MIGHMQVELDIPDGGAAEAENQRRAPRVGTRLKADVRRSGTVRVQATVIDMSVTGFRLESDERLPLGAPIWVRIGQLAPLEAKVVWRDGYRAGCAFNAPLHPSVLDHIVRIAG
jgi:hypothetical protein